MAETKMYKLLGADGEFYLSPEKGELGGNGALKIYGRMDCPSGPRFRILSPILFRVPPLRHVQVIPRIRSHR